MENATRPGVKETGATSFTEACSGRDRGLSEVAASNMSGADREFGAAGGADDVDVDDSSSTSTSNSIPLDSPTARHRVQYKPSRDETRVEGVKGVADIRKRKRDPYDSTATIGTCSLTSSNATSDRVEGNIMASGSDGGYDIHRGAVKRHYQGTEDRLTTVEGQLRKNPHMTEEEARIAAKREYNRRNAARARSRNKSLMEDLQRKVTDLTRSTEELQRTNDILTAQLELLTQQNESLMAEAAAAQAQPSLAHPPPEGPPTQPSNAPLTVTPSHLPLNQAQSLLNAVGLLGQLLQLQSLMQQAQGHHTHPLPLQQQPSTQGSVATSSTPGVLPLSISVTPSPSSRSSVGPTGGLAHGPPIQVEREGSISTPAVCPGSSKNHHPSTAVSVSSTVAFTTETAATSPPSSTHR